MLQVKNMSLMVRQKEGQQGELARARAKEERRMGAGLKAVESVSWSDASLGILTPNRSGAGRVNPGGGEAGW